MLEVGKNSLNLMKQIIINLLPFVIEGGLLRLLIIDSHEQESKLFVYEELLNHTVHVTDVA